MIAILSTGFDAGLWRDQHFASLKAQTVRPDKHFYVDAKDEPGAATEHRYNIVRTLPPETIVCEVDADDWLADSTVLARVLEAYADPDCWLTFGQFRTWPGKQLGFAAPYTATDARNGSFRCLTWRATHLKTYRAGLFQQIPLAHFRRDGEWITRSVDRVCMFPMLEMAQERHQFIGDILYSYNTTNPHAAPNKGEDGPGGPEWDMSAWIARQPVFKRLEARPW